MVNHIFVLKSLMAWTASRIQKTMMLMTAAALEVLYGYSDMPLVFIIADREARQLDSYDTRY
jgi:hypothetical protein